jgi:ABC-type multidrug transport system permease subunit
MICNLIMYWMVDLNDSSPSNFFKCYLVIALMCLNGNSLGLLLGSLFSDPKIAVAMFPLIMMPFMLFGGFFSNRSSYQDWIGWLEYLSPFKYGF